MNNIEAAKETIRITKSGGYEAGGKKIIFSSEEHSGVTVYFPEAGQELLNQAGSLIGQGALCEIKVVNSDYFEAARDMDNPYVMNFANAHNPGDVAGFFRQVLMDERYGSLFDEVRFAIYGAENGNNITAFRQVFA